MKWFSYMAAAAAFVAGTAAGAEERSLLDGSYLLQLQERDSVLIADQLEYGFRLDKVAEGTGFAFPDYSKGFRDSVEVLTPWRLDTLAVHKGKKGTPSAFDIKGSVIITSFDEGRYELPPIPVLRRSPEGTVDTLVFKPQLLEVKTMPVDTSTFEIHDIKAQVRYPLTFKEVLPYMLGGLLLAVLTVFAVRMIIRRRRDGASGSIRKEPAHILALRKLDHLRGSKLWAADKQKAFYSGVTDVLREYMVARYGISALEMTTKEIFDGLSLKDLPEDLYSELRQLFERADYVKFAKYVATDEENASAVPVAVRFVTQTYQVETDADSASVENPAEKSQEKVS